MIITCLQRVPIHYREDGKPKIIWTEPGSRNYPIDYKDPMVAEQLRVYRKHGRIGFDELLDTDVEILKTIDPELPPEEKAKALKAAVTIKPSPVGRIVKKKKRSNGTRTVKSGAAAKAKDVKPEPKKDPSKS